MSHRFACLTVEGSLIGADVIDQIADGKAQGQKPADFNLDSRHLTDEIAAAWTEARTFWSSFQRQLARPNKNETTLTRDLWLIPLFRLLGYELSYSQKAAEVDGATYAVSHRAGTDENAPPIHLVGWQQELHRRAESGRPRLSPHALMQEYLNRTAHVWGLIANGHTLRLLRDSQLIRRQSYIEFDLRQMMEAEKFSDFALLFRLLHRTRLARGADDAKDCLLEHYHQQTIEQGGRVRDRLRDGVEEAIKQFANALLRHPKNQRLREQLDSGHFKAEDFYQQLLRLIYRLLFLMVAEERDLLKADADADGRVYRENYGVERLRKQLHVRAAANDYEDLWIGLQSLFTIFQDERLAAVLNVSPLNGDLFDTHLTPLLAGTRITNRDLLTAFEHLALYRPTAHASPQRINYRDLNVEELGSVYESLLDYHPVITVEYGRRLFNLVSGMERKSTGSYYTPTELVNELIESALVPVIKDRLDKATTRDERERAVLSIKVCDPACGSGHFLLAAARRLGLELARVRSGELEPTPEEQREARREVIGECIYGVDKNPLAVDLCKVALWIEGNSRGKPLKFIDHRIRLGDSLVGVFDLSVLTEGIPDEAFEPVGGDDKPTARKLKSRNRDERGRNEDERSLPFDPEAELHARADERSEMLRIRDDSVAEANRKKALFQRLRESEACCVEQTACNLWTGAFFADLTAENVAQQRVPTTGAFSEYLTINKALDTRHALTTSLTEPLADRLRFFHWPLEFPEVLEQGGFDVVLGNPPWERIKLQEQEFFAERDLEIASAPNKAARGRLIATLGERRPELWQAYRKATHDAEATSKFMRHGGRFPLTARGDINTYAIFAEQLRAMLNATGRAGFIVPTGIATDDSYKAYFADVMNGQHLVSLFDFENREQLFPSLHTKTKFCLVTVTGAKFEKPSFCFLATTVDDLYDEVQVFNLTSSDLQLINPNTLTCPLFRTRTDAELTRKIYERVPVLINERAGENPWGIGFSTMFHMSNDSGLFPTREQMERDGFALKGNRFSKGGKLYLPLYEAKMMWQFDHRYGSHEGLTERAKELLLASGERHADPSYVALPWYWVSFEEMMLRSARVPNDLIKAYKQNNHDKLIDAIVAWAAGWHFNHRNEQMTQANEYNPFACAKDQRFKDAFIRFSLRPAVAEIEAEYPLTETEEAQLCRMAQEGSSAYKIAETLMKLRTPKWFLGFRDITDTRNERTTVISLLPQAGVGHTMPLISFYSSASTKLLACFLANLNSFVFDYLARQKVGGMHLTYSYLKQLPVLPPAAYNPADITFITPRVLELVYTSHDLEAFAADCGYAGVPFKWDEERRASLRAELDAYFARLYGLTRDELRYVLDPKDLHGPDFPSETFRVLKEKEESRYGEYRTRRLVLEAWDRLA